MMKLFTCSQCGERLTASEVANETKFYVRSTAHTRVRSVVHHCQECHAANEWQRELALRQAREEALADLTDEERAGYLARKAAREGTTVIVYGEQCHNCGGYDEPDTHDEDCALREPILVSE